jgi:hypothetical protein
MSDIFSKLNNLKDKLNDLEMTVSEEVKKEQIQGVYKVRIQKKMPQVRQNLSEKVKINTGDEAVLITSQNSIKNFPYKLSIREEVSNLRSDEELWVDSSESLFTVILEIIRFLTNNPNLEAQRKLVIFCHPEALKIHAKEFFLEDTDTVLEKFELVYCCPWIKRKVMSKQKTEKNKWNRNVSIKCYKCLSQNDGTHWKKKPVFDDPEDNFTIEGYIAICLVCDSDNTKY